MKQRVKLLVGLCGILGCSAEPPPPGEVPDPPDVVYGTVTERDRSGSADGADFRAVVAAHNEVALKMLAALRAQQPDRNLAVGNYSIGQVLGMLYAGAAGTTADEMQRALAWSLPRDRLFAALNALELELLTRGQDVTLAIANRIWAQKGLSLRPSFLDVLTRHFGAPLALADFTSAPEQARGTINDWVNRATQDKIPELFPPGTIKPNTRLVLVNTLYLDAPWKYRFDPRATRKQAFTRLDGSQIDVDMMHFDDFLPSASHTDWRAVELPYAGDELAMVVIVPTDLQAFEAGLNAERLDQIFAQIRHGGIHLSLPKLRFSFHTSLKETLSGLGMPSMFGDADFSGIATDARLFVDHVEHEVFIDVDEAGTRAAAATGAALALSHGPTITVNRPYLFAIRDRPTGALLFLGRVLDPSR